ncbi:MAG: lipopolysaccharide biosynthesis protein [Clostridia bacterium]|nr:lipopolysaccharide biosynthesis protein [Clostridia bacterium]
MEKQPSVKIKSVSGGFWLGIRFGGTQLVRFVISVILARLLEPELYTILGIITIFTSLAEKFVTHCFAMALIQRKIADEDDFASVFWIDLAVSIGIVALLWLIAPWIADFYGYAEIVPGIRLLSLVVIVDSLGAVLNARLSRELAFKKMSLASIAAMIVSGGVGVTLAFCGFGLWALLWQQLVSELTMCIAELIMTRWLPKRRLRFDRLREMFRYGWKILAGNFVSHLYGDLTGLVLGKAFPGDTLGFYNKGRQMPNIVGENLSAVANTTMFPTYAANQDDGERLRDLVRKTVRIDAFLVFPIMAGLALVAEPLTGLLLTDKWLPAVPYMRVACFVWAVYPLDGTLLEGVCARGRSDLHLKVMILRRGLGLALLCAAAFLLKTPMAIAWSVAVTALFSLVQSMLVARPFFGYPLRAQLWDMLPPLLLSLAMAAAVLPLGLLPLPRLWLLALQVLVGAGVYVGLSMLFRLEVFRYFCGAVGEFVQKWKRERKDVDA